MRLKLIVCYSFHGHNFVRLKAKQSNRRQWCPYHLRIRLCHILRIPSPPPRTGTPLLPDESSCVGDFHLHQTIIL